MDRLTRFFLIVAFCTAVVTAVGAALIGLLTGDGTDWLVAAVMACAAVFLLRLLRSGPGSGGH